MKEFVCEWKLVASKVFSVSKFLYAEPRIAVNYWKKYVRSSPQFNEACESLTVLIVNSRKRIVGHQTVSIGTLDSLLVHPREVFRTAIAANAFAIILVHNHPSGESEPSLSDESMTSRIKAASQIVGIKLLDHIIVTRDDFFSFVEKGLLTISN